MAVTSFRMYLQNTKEEKKQQANSKVDNNRSVVNAMTPTNTDSPLRRSEVGTFRDAAHNVVAINDDEEERRQARRRTLLNANVTVDTSSSTIESSETIKKCLEIYNSNKLSRENAWSLSLIDTLSTLLDRHHKSINNFKVAGSSLEASSKVYGLRVDSVHIDVLRMSAGLNAQRFNERQIEDDDDNDVATGGDGSADPKCSAAGAKEGADGGKTAVQKTKQKRTRKPKSTITKNKETLNARLDTVPMQCPVFGKLNSIVGSINSSNRLMNNCLLTTDSELRLRTNFKFWDARQLEPSYDYTAEVALSDDTDKVPCERLLRLKDDLQLRPLHGGYAISDTPEVIADDKDFDFNYGEGIGGGDDFPAEGAADADMISMAFDINAECEPVPTSSEQTPMIDVDYEILDDDLTIEERTAINNCRGLRKPAVQIDDLRPVDANSKLEYSYRPLDKISQFWAGPSHWKFKRVRTRPSTLSLQGGNTQIGGRATVNQRARSTHLNKTRSRQLNFSEFHDDQFIKLDNNYKPRKTNYQKKWDPRKLKLPTDFQLDPQMFFKYEFAPGLSVEDVKDEIQSALVADDVHDADDGVETAAYNHFDQHFSDDSASGNFMNVSTMSTNALNKTSPSDANVPIEDHVFGEDVDNIGNGTVLEIANEFEGAPSQVTKIIVPFAKRAKVIDMKNLKRCCIQLINIQMKRTIDESEIPTHANIKNEQYETGMASFKETYKHLPDLLTPSMVEATSTSVAFYSMLHLANDHNLRLIMQEDLEDFKIRHLKD